MSLPPAADVLATRAIPWQPWVVGEESPSLDRFGGDGIFLHAVEAVFMQTSSSDGHSVKGRKAGLLAELTTKGPPLGGV